MAIHILSIENSIAVKQRWQLLLLQMSEDTDNPPTGRKTIPTIKPSKQQ